VIVEAPAVLRACYVSSIQVRIILPCQVGSGVAIHGRLAPVFLHHGIAVPRSRVGAHRARLPILSRERVRALSVRCGLVVLSQERIGALSARASMRGFFCAPATGA
jgi:hypothetical protein